MGSVAAGSLFAFLQSMTVGGAAMSVFAGIGALGDAVVVGMGPVSLKGVMGGLPGRFRALWLRWLRNFREL
jgi:hypothetical protein